MHRSQKQIVASASTRSSESVAVARDVCSEQDTTCIVLRLWLQEKSEEGVQSGLEGAPLCESQQSHRLR